MDTSSIKTSASALVEDEITDGERTPPFSNRQRRGEYGSLPSTDPLDETNNNGSNGNGQTKLPLPNRSRVASRWPRGTPTSTSTGLASSLVPSSPERSERSLRTHRLNQRLECLIVVIIVVVLTLSSVTYWYFNIHQKHVLKNQYRDAVAAHAKAAQERRQTCRGVDWLTACDRLTNAAGARRRRQQRVLLQQEQHPQQRHPTSKSQQPRHHYRTNNHRNRGGMNKNRRHHHPRSKGSNNVHRVEPNASLPVHLQEEELLESDDPSVTYDNNCLKVYRLDINHGQRTFPYHSSQLLRLGGNQTMALIIQHGALRDSESYFCSFKKLMRTQTYRDFEEILVIAPDFNYATDDLVHPNDAVWNTSKPWGDWRVGAESDPSREHDDTSTHGSKYSNYELQPTISSFDVLDNILALVTDKKLFPNIDKISFVGHSAGTFGSYLHFFYCACIFISANNLFVHSLHFRE
jgi:hypothetical protein